MIKNNFSKIIIFLLLFTLFASYASASDFCDGFNQGYITGYKQASNTSLDPLVPPCPLMPLKSLSDPESDYEYGYTIGYKEGFSKGSNKY